MSDLMKKRKKQQNKKKKSQEPSEELKTQYQLLQENPRLYQILQNIKRLPPFNAGQQFQAGWMGAN